MPHSLRCEDGSRQRGGDDRLSTRLRWGMAHPEDERKALGRELAHAREGVKLSLSAAATELTRRGFPIQKQAIGAWEVGRNVPDALWLRRIARLYRTSIDVLAGNSDEEVWPFTDELQKKVIHLSDEELSKAENVLRAHLGLPQLPLSVFHQPAQMSTTLDTAAEQDTSQEVGVGWPEQDNLAAPSSNGSRSEDRRRPRQKSGRGA
jgi:hypothetical protein